MAVQVVRTQAAAAARVGKSKCPLTCLLAHGLLSSGPVVHRSLARSETREPLAELAPFRLVSLLRSAAVVAGLAVLVCQEVRAAVQEDGLAYFLGALTSRCKETLVEEPTLEETTKAAAVGEPERQEQGEAQSEPAREMAATVTRRVLLALRLREVAVAAAVNNLRQEEPQAQGVQAAVEQEVRQQPQQTEQPTRVAVAAVAVGMAQLLWRRALAALAWSLSE